VQTVSSFLSDNPIVIIVVTMVALWPLLRAGWKAAARIWGFFSRRVSRSSDAYHLASSDSLFYLSHVIFLAGLSVMLEVLIAGIGLTFPSVNTTPVAHSNLTQVAVGLVLIFFRGLQGLFLGDIIAVSFAVRRNRERKLPKQNPPGSGDE
jgi:hypothetical protein